MEKYKVVYAIEKIFTSLKFSERQSIEFQKAKKEHDAENYAVAFNLYEKLAQKGNSWAMRNIGVLYRYGLGRDKDLEKAKEWYIKAVNKGNSEAAYDLGSTIHLESQETRGDYEKWYLKAAEMGNPYGSYMSATIVGYKDPSKRLEYTLKAADLGISGAMVEVGNIYQKGESVEKDYNKAAEYFKKAMVKGNSEALGRLGNLYFDGSGVEKNRNKAMELYLKSAQKGNPDGMRSIAWIYEAGRGGFPKDYAKAESWYFKAIEVKDVYSYLKLAELYSVPDNKQPQKALENYEKAAEIGYTDGMLQTANIYYSSKDGITKDFAKAVKYYEKYYERKKKNEAYIDNIIDMYNRGGNGLEKNKEKVKYWREIRRK